MVQCGLPKATYFFSLCLIDKPTFFFSIVIAMQVFKHKFKVATSQVTQREAALLVIYHRGERQ